MNEDCKLNSTDIQKVCRICLNINSSMVPLENLLETPDIPQALTISEVITKITSIPVSGFPNKICWNCMVLLTEAFKFKIQFEKSNKILSEYICEENETYNLSEEHDFLDETNSKEILIKTPRKAIKPSKHFTRGAKKRYTPSKFSDEEDAFERNKFLHPCPICDKEFTSYELKIHIRTHKAFKRYLSIQSENHISSNAIFYNTHNPKNDKLSIFNRPERIHKCYLCPGEYSAADLRLHFDTHRNQNEFKCDQCDRIFKKLNHLNTHRVKHLKEYPFKCKHCGKGFVIKTNYDCHILTHNTNQELPHECKHCLKRFSNPEHLNRHIIIHTENVSYSVKYRVCKCTHCLKTFKDKSELKQHHCTPIEKIVNTRYPCKICYKVFKNPSGLYNHNRNIHKLKGAKILCSVCGHYVSNIYNHMMRHSGEKPFECNQCGKRFMGKQQLRQHLLVHSGLKPYVCSVCAKAFNSLYNLQVHERIHKGDRCHICNVCNKGFLEKSYLKKHMNVHTKS